MRTKTESNTICGSAASPWTSLSLVLAVGILGFGAAAPRAEAVPLSPKGVAHPGGEEIVFDWDLARPGDTWTQVYVERGGVFWWGMWHQGVTTWDTMYPFPDGTFTWYTRGWSAAEGYSAWSSGAVFAVGTVVNESDDGQTGFKDITVRWKNIEGVAEYEVYLSRNGAKFKSFIHPAEAGTTTLFFYGNDGPEESPTLTTDLPHGNYKIWIRPVGGTWSKPTMPVIGLCAPELSGDETGTVFPWVLPPGATWGRVWCQNASGAVVVDQWVEGDMLTVPLLADEPHSWWLQTWGPTTGYGAWSKRHDFTPPQPTP